MANYQIRQIVQSKKDQNFTGIYIKKQRSKHLSSIVQHDGRRAATSQLGNMITEIPRSKGV